MAVRSHYRTQMDFSWHGLDEARKTLKNLDEAYGRLRQVAGNSEPSEFAHAAYENFEHAMNNDLQTSEAVAAVQTLVGESNRLIQANELSAVDAAAVVRLLEGADRVLGLRLGATDEVSLTPELQALVDARATARSDKDWAEADRLRDELAAAGIAVKDSKDGQHVSYL